MGGLGLRDWLLPALLAAQQLVIWPGQPLWQGDAVEPWQVCAGVTLTTALTVALCLRRRFPVVAVGVAEGALFAGLALPDDASVTAAVAVFVALYSVAVHRSARTTLLVLAGLVLCGGFGAVEHSGFSATAGAEVIFSVALNLAVAGLGRSRRRWLAGRQAAAGELRRAEAERGRAVLTERQRLARELHDVSAHHLTSVVVTAEAAVRLGDARPQLTAQALTAAAEGGRATRGALERLVTVMDGTRESEEAGLEERIAALVAGFERLGQPVRVELEPAAGGLGGEVAEAAFGIVREALTNALRYAPGAGVRVSGRLRDDVVRLEVADEGAAGAPVQKLGSGRGTDGMRERAAALGGSLRSGPRDGGGWSVRAHLPLAASAAQRQAALTTAVPADATIVVAVAAVPVFAVVTEQLAAAAVVGLAAVLHALPLLWRRTASWRVLWAVLATAWVAPAGLALGCLDTVAAWSLAAGGGFAECVALYAVGAFGGRARRTWLAVGAAAAGLGAVYSVLTALSEWKEMEPVDGGFTVFFGFLLAVLLAVPLAGIWVLGAVARARRTRVRGREEDALAEAVRAAVAEAAEERRRIAEELRGDVLGHADAVVARAGDGDLAAAAERARAGLAAMRKLLSALRREPAAPESVQGEKEEKEEKGEVATSLSE